MKKEYPITLYVKQLAHATGETRSFEQVVKSQKEHFKFIEQTGRMTSNFSHEISLKPFDKQLKLI